MLMRQVNNGLEWVAEGREVWTRHTTDGPVGAYRYRVAQCFDHAEAGDHARLAAMAPELARFCLSFLRTLAEADEAGVVLPDNLRGLSAEALALALKLNGINEPREPNRLPALPAPSA
ncbi:MAG: hypothetical protein EAZ99_13485 [Alphaproteobacteria bacterium]|nr:hypothetical protein [Alphaproteobacteria bacterium]TAD88505.1 MAG: hypothetical protein EAZ99_13485 [Alphaproteobacteria bacterium]